ncbi:hypothetical protein, partial [Saccharothrix sp. ST-888]|uniref:hypothetical protein n=1 Tax=Saccharothrix sp. ST-888 TaxID=1427391 RepID=UPI001E3FD30F
MLASFAEAWVRGVAVDRQAAAFEGTGAGRGDLPTSAFQQETHSRRPLPARLRNITSAGLRSAGDPGLAPTVRVGEAEGRLLTGRTSADSHRWPAE